MNIESINKDIAAIEKAIKIIEKTENYLHFKKSSCIFTLCEAVNELKEKRDNQIDFLTKLK